MRSSVLSTLLLSLLVPVSADAGCITPDGVGFALQGDEATSREHGLTWKRCAIGMQWDAGAGACSGAARDLGLNEAIEYAARQGDGWRVPTGQELETLILDTCEGPKIDSVAFPDIAATDFGDGALFWTSSEAMPDMFYFFDFTNGFFDMHSQGFHLSVLLVKDSARR
ncbi:MAG: hypothetical protein CML23_17745 [Rhizobiaceae bacterium]|nr:hypothetical protein [Rhizobiaceae bacterium]|tara:strand:- start:23 stop:526 length:504 start_codon:yes stop_codon:yes gene_type:complete